MESSIPMNEKNSMKIRDLARKTGYTPEQLILLAITEWENNNVPSSQNTPVLASDEQIAELLKDATEKVWKLYPDLKKHQQILMAGIDSFEDCMIDSLNCDFLD